MPRKTPPRKSAAARALRGGFNEAAARCRGKRGLHGQRFGRTGDASMRPRPDAAENRRPARRTGQPRRGFNEAAARCRGKRREVLWTSRPVGRPASMRPRPDAAENSRRGSVEYAAMKVASMRPRPDAAENAAPRRRRLCPSASASMRPRPDAAENAGGRGGDLDRGGRFNEAAARCRGKQKYRPARAARRFRLQ